ncbi:hypothetical protein CLV98_101584 [Dyadobacter jejuensis]|uniref:Uncharacterized protein n=1 Tax=Dyadobacter jejuensis TaxID=1082580 RepID=A0A316AUN0_9BACT|nr:hypothetical protein CLV98_101584 [Dyadobacter jejuensis]
MYGKMAKNIFDCAKQFPDQRINEVNKFNDFIL